MPTLLLSFITNKNVLYTLGIAFLTISAYFYGHSKGVDSERVKWEAAQAQVLKTQLAEIDRLALENRKLVAEYQQVEVKRKELYRKLQNEIAKATNGNVCFTPDAWMLWNKALGGQSSLPRTSPGTTQASARTDTAILSNAVTNFEQYKECRDIHEKIIQWHDKNWGK